LPRSSLWTPSRITAYARRCFELGLAVTLPNGSRAPIPPMVMAQSLDKGPWGEMRRDGHVLLGALARVAGEVLADPADGRYPCLFGHFRGFEREVMERTWPSQRVLANTRIDFFVEAGKPRALEVNTTIPAMQGYVDIVNRAFVETVGEARGLPGAEIRDLLDRVPSQANNLLDALLGGYRALGGEAETPTIGIVARRNDAQTTDLAYIAERWRERGHRVVRGLPEEMTLSGDRVAIRGEPVDLVYRHIWAKNVDPASPFADALREPERFFVLNPPSAHLEVKGLLAEVSALAMNEDPGPLSPEQAEMIRRVVPWTRSICMGRTTGPAGETIDLVPYVRSHPDLVLKKSWDYGGKTVFLAQDLEEEATRKRLRAVVGPRAPLDWEALVEHAANDPDDCWVAQHRVEIEPTRLEKALPDGEIEIFTGYADASVYATHGIAPWGAGGVSRASESRVVNIMGGGGLVPLLPQDVLDDLFLQ
jgi:hypothetical protein